MPIRVKVAAHLWDKQSMADWDVAGATFWTDFWADFWPILQNSFLCKEHLASTCVQKPRF